MDKADAARIVIKLASLGKLHDAEEALNDILDQAYKKGKEVGYDEGYIQGNDDGYEVGKEASDD